MTEIVAPPTRQAIAARDRSAPGQVTGKLAEACRLIVHEGMPWDEAAVKAGLTVRAMRLALKKPHVLKYIRDERHLLLSTIAAQNPRRMAELRDQNDNAAAAVRAGQVIEQMSTEGAPSRATAVLPGLTIQIVNSIPADRDRLVDVTPPTIDAEPVRQIEPRPPRSNTFIGVDEIAGSPSREPDWPPEPEPAPPPREPRSLDEWKEALLHNVQPLAPPSSSGMIVGAPKQPYDSGYQAPRGRQLPLSRRWRARRGGDE